MPRFLRPHQHSQWRAVQCHADVSNRQASKFPLPSRHPWSSAHRHPARRAFRHQKSGAKRSLCTRRVLEGPPACPLTGIVACQQARQKVATMHARKRHRPAGCHRLRRVQDHTLDVSAGSVQDRRDLPAPALPDPPADVRCLGPQGPKEESGLLFVAEERQRPTSEAGERQRLDASSPRPADHPPPVYRRSALGPVLFPSNSPIPGPVSSHPCSSRHVCAIALVKLLAPPRTGRGKI